MREIKFRAWDNVNKEMTEFGNQTILQQESEGLLFYRQDSTKLSTDDYVLMQSTGLRDKDGIEIFEADILERTFRKVASRPRWCVEWNGHKGRWVFGKSLSKFSLTLTSARDLKVIGNIYENPELLSH